jgi:hypothetical protein
MKSLNDITLKVKVNVAAYQTVKIDSRLLPYINQENEPGVDKDEMLNESWLSNYQS